MNEFEFTLLVEGADINAEASLDRLFQAGCGDATFGAVDGVQFGDFTREAESFEPAIVSAIIAVESAVPGARVVRVEPDDLVSAADIADRLGRSRESVRLLTAGARGPGGFPAPACHGRERSPRWRWYDVARWLAEHEKLDPSVARAAEFQAFLNAQLDGRRILRRHRAEGLQAPPWDHFLRSLWSAWAEHSQRDPASPAR